MFNAIFKISGRRSLLAAALSGLALAGAQAADEPPSGRVLRVMAESGTPESRTSPLDTYNYNEKPLKNVLDFLSTKSNLNIRCLHEKDERLPVTLYLENVTYRAVLDFIGKKYGLTIDDSKIKQKVIMVSSPDKISIQLKDADIRKVIDIIAAQTEANIVIGPEVTGKISLNLNNVPWMDALNIIVKTLDFVAVPDSNDTIRITSPAKLQTSLETRIFNLAYLTPEGTKYSATIDAVYAQKTTDSGGQGFKTAGLPLVEMLAKIKSDAPKSNILLVNKTNAIVAQDTATKLDMMEELINKLDVAPKQIHISVKMLEMSDEDIERIGVNWTQGLQFSFTPLSNWPTTFPFDAAQGLNRSILGRMAAGYGFDENGFQDITSYSRAAQGADLGINKRVLFVSGTSGGTPTTSTPAPQRVNALSLGSMGFGQTNALFEMLHTKTNAKVVQTPYLVTLDNEEATIQVGLLYRYAEQVTIQTEGGGSSQGFKEASGSPIKLGTQLLIIPHVTGPENNVLLTVIPKTENLVNERTFIGPSGTTLVLPITNNKVVVSRMLLRNGETGVIGGLREESETMVDNKVPVLGEIPFIGRLFRHRSRSKPLGSNRTVQIFVTPTIVDVDQRVDFKSQLESLKAEITKPFAPIGEEESKTPGDKKTP